MIDSRLTKFEVIYEEDFSSPYVIPDGGGSFTVSVNADCDGRRLARYEAYREFKGPVVIVGMIMFEAEFDGHNSIGALFKLQSGTEIDAGPVKVIRA